ncbi:MAG: type II secretion system F family protein [Cryobacterium sp.]|uniref:type II secretion system F family protein n=1 Tax=unclassified Cryobacterium TaxID=2649013 RepID=UPI0018C9DFBE|nr:MULTISPECIES: type II secretion system F family protein [unclassified Cryobacterium]MCY7405456.1 type II secretion system F family protein [Cryobacterium sp.]
MRRVDVVPPIEEVAAVTQQLAVLLSAGVSPVTAWGYLVPVVAPTAVGRRIGSAPAGAAGAAGAADTATTGILRAAARAAARGDSVADAIAGQAHRHARENPSPGGTRVTVAARARRRGDAAAQAERAWLGLAAAWQVATQAGSPLAGCLRELATSLRELAQVQRDLEVALASPRATARLVMVLPLIGVVLGSLMGFDSLHTLFATVPGLVCLGGGALLMLAAASWNRALVRRAAPADLTPGLRLELMAIAMSGGGSIDRSRALVRAAAKRYGIAPGADVDPIDRVLDLSTRAGVPAAELLRSAAEQLRRDARSAGQRRAATLSVTLMLPLGLCVLPAFMLVGVVPLLISVLSSTLTTL